MRDRPPAGGAHIYLFVYDVSDRRRWRRVFKLLGRAGEWTQLSTFLVRQTPARRQGLEAALRRVLVAGEDRLLIVDLGPEAQAAGRLAGLGNIPLPGPPRTVIL